MKAICAIALGVSLVMPLTVSEAQYRGQAVAFTPSTSTAPAITLSESTPLLRHLALDCDVDRLRGREAAGMNHGSSNWMLGGIISGVALGLIGTLVIYAVASSSSVEVQSIPDGVEPACYRDGYVSRAKSKNSNDALVGGLLGTAVLVLLVVAATSGSSY